MPPLIVVIWGTKVRRRPLGLFAGFCPGCARLVRFRAQAIEKSSHVYWIPLGYREAARFAECEVCGTAVEVPPDVGLMDEKTAGNLPMDAFLGATNPALARERPAIEAAVAAQAPAEENRLRAAAVFLANQERSVLDAAAQSGGWVGLAFLGCLAVGGAVFALGGPIPGGVMAALLLAFLLLFRVRVIHAIAARTIRPRLGRFLEATGLSWQILQSMLDRGEVKAPRVRRHFREPRYDDLRGRWERVV